MLKEVLVSIDSMKLSIRALEDAARDFGSNPYQRAGYDVLTSNFTLKEFFVGTADEYWVHLEGTLAHPALKVPAFNHYNELLHSHRTSVFDVNLGSCSNTCKLSRPRLSSIDSLHEQAKENFPVSR